MAKNTTPLEDDDCKALVKYMELFKSRLKFTHIANEASTSSWGARMRNKAMGMRGGLLDYVITIKKKSGKNLLLFLEMKREKGSVTSKEQKAWIDELNKVDQIEVKLAKGYKEAELLIKSLMKL